MNAKHVMISLMIFLQGAPASHAGKTDAHQEGNTGKAASVDAAEVDGLLKARQSLIDKLLKAVEAPTKTREDAAEKSSAILVLGKLRAIEVVDVLVKHIEFRNPNVVTRARIIEEQHPSVQALMDIGSPARNAILRAISEMKADKGSVAKTSDRDHARLFLLVYTLKRIEGDKVAAFLLKEDAAKATSQQSPVYEQALKLLGG